MPRERLVSPDLISKEEESFNRSLRPPTLEEYVGQRKVVEKLTIALQAARQRNEPLEHALFYGPPGLGKTTLAYIIANYTGSKITTTSGPALERTGDLMGILTNLAEGEILFIDEIHRLPVNIEEFLYPAMEDFKVDFVVDKGMFAKTINIPLKKFTLIGATTRAGSLSAPLRNRFMPWMSCVRSLCARRASWQRRSRIRGPRKWRAGLEEPRASPTVCCAGCVTSRKSRLPAS
jgi:Holliday junction DNA helicase RuvB